MGKLCAASPRIARNWAILSLMVSLVPVLCAGCARQSYRQRADREANYLIREKSMDTPWETSSSYTIQPDPRSRFFDPSNPDCPLLPPAGPDLYQYRLPELGSSVGQAPETLPPTFPGASSGPVTPLEITPPQFPQDELPEHSARIERLPPVSDVRLILFQEETGFQEESGVAVATEQEDPFSDRIMTVEESIASFGELEIQAVGERYWEDIPLECLARMLESVSLDEEYQDTFGVAPAQDLLDDAPRLTLENLFELALLNSRLYQSEKEQLYRAALALSLERYAYATKFTVGGNGVDPSYTHRRSNGTTVNSLGVPSQIGGSRLLATGGTILGRFANDVLLTFNGPAGFAADVSSELLFDVTQTVFQRDIILNSLIQSERDLIYAARRFARFRKEFFVSVASDYYGLLARYRGIEIEGQNYFAQVRTYQQALEEVQSGIASAPTPTAVNQFEQGVLTGLSRLISVCNSLEQDLDNLKVTIGLPTETPINIALGELDQLTLRDSTEVERERAKRWNNRLEVFRDRVQDLEQLQSKLKQRELELSQQAGREVGPTISGATQARITVVQGEIEANQDEIAANHADILNASYSLAEHVILWSEMRSQTDQFQIDDRELRKARALFRLKGAWLDSNEKRGDLNDVTSATPPAPRILVFQRQLDTIESQLSLIKAQGQFATSVNVPDHKLDPARQKHGQLRSRAEQLRDDLAAGLRTPETLDITKMLDGATLALAELDTLAQGMDRLLFGDVIASVDLPTTLAEVDVLLAQATDLFDRAGTGLVQMGISADDAMVTALVQRLDLMNERGALADQWRGVKLAADELRSVLNLNVSQRIGTEKNRPFDFTMRNSQTRLGLSFDLPLNRKAQRNAYRRSLINYNSSWRGLMGFEDGIKLRIRQQLRGLDQARVQYRIAVASAALQQEQVLSTRLSMILGLPGVGALDVLKALTDSREALSDVANARIGYITLRADFALDLEVMMLDDIGFWPEINDERYQPQADGIYPANAGSAYGSFPAFLKVSKEMKRMLHYAPPGQDGPGQDGPVEDGPVEDGPVEDGPVEDGPVEDGPVEDGPVEDGPVEDAMPADLPEINQVE